MTCHEALLLSSHTVFPSSCWLRIYAGYSTSFLQTVLLLPPDKRPSSILCAQTVWPWLFKAAFGFYLIGMGIYSGIQGWHTYGAGGLSLRSMHLERR